MERFEAAQDSHPIKWAWRRIDNSFCLRSVKPAGGCVVCPVTFLYFIEKAVSAPVKDAFTAGRVLKFLEGALAVIIDAADGRPFCGGFAPLKVLAMRRLALIAGAPISAPLIKKVREWRAWQDAERAGA